MSARCDYRTVVAGLLGLATLVGCGDRRPPAVTVRLGGGQIPVEFVESWLQDAKSHSFAVTRVPLIYLSIHGFENLQKGACDIACTDRPLTVRELADFGDRQVEGRRVAFYGFGLYVNMSNPLDGIYSRHLRLVFQQRIKDWKELAGQDLPGCAGPIHLYGTSKESRAGVLAALLAKIWFGDPTWTVEASDAAVVARVASDPQGLGFASLGFDGGEVRYLGLRQELRGDPVLPSLQAIEDERYGFAKLIYVYYVTPPTPEVQAVLDYLYSPEGERVIRNTKLWPVPTERAAVKPTP